MHPGEFDLINRYFARLGASRDDVVLGVGDDGALVAPPAGAREVTAIASSALDPGREPAEHGAALIAEALERLDGARPAWATLALTLDRIDPAWVQRFASGLDAAASRAGIAIVGGDTTSGTRRATLFVHGHRDGHEDGHRDGRRDGGRD